MLPAWATVLIVVAGSAVSGLVGALTQMRHQRSEAIRERMLTTADEFCTHVGDALAHAHELGIKYEAAMFGEGKLADAQVEDYANWPPADRGPSRREVEAAYQAFADEARKAVERYGALRVPLLRHT